MANCARGKPECGFRQRARWGDICPSHQSKLNPLSVLNRKLELQWVQIHIHHVSFLTFSMQRGQDAAPAHVQHHWRTGKCNERCAELLTFSCIKDSLASRRCVPINACHFFGHFSSVFDHIFMLGRSESFESHLWPSYALPAEARKAPSPLELEVFSLPYIVAGCEPLCKRGQECFPLAAPPHSDRGGLRGGGLTNGALASFDYRRGAQGRGSYSVSEHFLPSCLRRRSGETLGHRPRWFYMPCAVERGHINVFLVYGRQRTRAREIQSPHPTDPAAEVTGTERKCVS